MKQFFKRFKRFIHIPINESNELYGTINAAYSRLSKIKVSSDHTIYAVEKYEVLSLLKKAKSIINKYA